MNSSTMFAPSHPQYSTSSEADVETTIKSLCDKFSLIPPFRKSTSTTICAALLIPTDRRHTLQALLDAGELDYKTFAATEDDQS